LYFSLRFCFLGQGADSNEGSFNLNYINVPLMMKYYVADKFNFGSRSKLVLNICKDQDGWRFIDLRDFMLLLY
jgi:hypothetical protein